MEGRHAARQATHLNPGNGNPKRKPPKEKARKEAADG